jgi:hypothetical protein
MIAAWAHSFNLIWPELPSEIQDRDADVWEPLVAIADAIDGIWPERAVLRRLRLSWTPRRPRLAWAFNY